MKLSNSIKVIFVTLLILCSSHLAVSQTKDWTISLGNNFSTYDFTNSLGTKIDFMKVGGGNSFTLGFEKSVLDTNKFVAQSSPKAIYYLQHKSLSKFLTKLQFGIRAVMNQYNATGDVQNITFDYQSNYAGLQVLIGPKIDLGKKWHFLLLGNISCQTILQGTQRVNGSYIDLTKDEMFNGLKVFAGYEISLLKQINKSFAFFITGNNFQTFNSPQAGKSNLNIKSTSLQIGLKISGLE